MCPKMLIFHVQVNHVLDLFFLANFTRLSIEYQGTSTTTMVHSQLTLTDDVATFVRFMKNKDIQFFVFFCTFLHDEMIFTGYVWIVRTKQAKICANQNSGRYSLVVF